MDSEDYSSLDFTEVIIKGGSLKDYAMRCANACWPLSRIRGGVWPVTTNLPLDDILGESYSEKLYKCANKELAKLSCMSKKEKELFAEKTYKEDMSRHKKHIAWVKERIEKLNKMKRVVEQWEPPTPNHTELKKFMVKQIDESLHEYEASIGKPPVKKDSDHLHKQLMERYQQDIDNYNSVRGKESTSQHDSERIWVRALVDSFK